MKSLIELFYVSVTSKARATFKPQYHFSLNAHFVNYVLKGMFGNISNTGKL